MGATLTTVNAISKDVYGPRIEEQLENEVVLTKRIEKTSRGTSSEQGGKFVTFPLHVRRNSGISYRNELEQLANAGQQGYVSVRVPLRYGYGRVHLSGQTMDLVNENFQAFSSAITEEMDGLKNDLLKDTNRILWGDGLGVLAVVDTDHAAVNTFSVGTGPDDVKFLDLDMMIDITNAAGVVQAANRKITAINEAAGDFTFDGAAVDPAVGWLIVRTGNYGREPNGLGNIVSDTATLHQLAPGTEPLWASKVDSTGGALSEAKMISMCDSVRQKGGRPTAIFASLGVRRAYFNLLTTQRRFTGTKTFEGGFTGLTFSYDEDIPVVTDVDAPKGKMWFIDEKKLTIYRRRPWYFEDKDGSVWKWVNNYDAFEAMMKQYWEFAAVRRNTHGVMTGITEG